MDLEHSRIYLVFMTLLIILFFLAGVWLIFWARRLFMLSGAIFYGEAMSLKILHYLSCWIVFCVGVLFCGSAINAFLEG
jgi:hypothetical protein